MKEQIIQLPDNLEVKEIKDCKIILVEKEKKLTYENIRDNELPKKCYIRNDIECTSAKQYHKLIAINKLMNLAKWLNDDWQPDWNNSTERKYYIYIINKTNNLFVDYMVLCNCSAICFKSKELAYQAVNILGEETIRLALCTDY